MDRNDFLNSIGMSAAAFALINCIGFKKNDTGTGDTAGPANVDLRWSLARQPMLSNHGATFDENGKATAGPARQPLTVYHTELTGTSLKIYS